MPFHHSSIRLKDVGLRTDGQSILDAVNWRVAPGERSAILGPNGSGKTSLLRIITGYRYPTEGDVEVLGETIGHTSLEELRRRIGLVDPSLEYLSGERMSAAEVVLSGFFGHLTIDFDEPTGEQIALARTMLADVGLKGMDDRVFATLSTGEQRRALLARALAGDPELLVLDEATAGLDILARETLLATIDRLSRRRPAMTVLVVTHHLDELLPDTSNVLLLSRGRAVVSGPPETVLTPTHLTQAFGVKVEVANRAGRWSWHVQPHEWTTLLEH